MRRTLSFCIVLLALLAAVPAFSFDPKCGSKPCGECHSLTLQEANQLLSGIVEKVTAVREAELKGFWRLDTENRGQKFPVYVDFAKKYLTSNPMLIAVDVSKIPLGDAIVVGKAEAPIKLIVFDDPECPYCQKLQPEMKKVVEARPDVAFHIKMYPLSIHPKAKAKAKAIVCERSLQLLDDSLAGKEIPPAKCETTAVDESLRLAETLGITSTPTLIFPDGRVRPGYKPADKILEMLPQPSPSQR